ncbi:hypothetical protein HYE60_11295 [Aggregatibacter actinomycetemcomitans]|uniref:hypothetical protein n=1 Tax=Aggregatibacter actinomycetemcomitans TaxID=714 RepID=UPI00197B4A87|nr:hypothetical protein [Aggregatibacter actinomycetemcomitans]MBN6075819.1 hypothetical protein [Aggregatibacter actinomycetemcomitans]
MTLHDIIIPWLDFAASRFSAKTNKYYRFLLRKHFSQFFSLNIKKLSPKLIFDTAQRRAETVGTCGCFLFSASVIEPKKERPP